MPSHLYMVIYLAGRMAGAIGPVPYDDGECYSRAAEFRAAIEHTDDTRIVCEYHPESFGPEAKYD